MTDTAHHCNWTAPRNVLQTSTPHFPYTTLEGFFHISDARAAVLKRENVRLRARLDAAEGMLTVMRQEIQRSRRTIQPLYANLSPPTPISKLRFLHGPWWSTRQSASAASALGKSRAEALPALSPLPRPPPQPVPPPLAQQTTRSHRFYQGSTTLCKRMR